MNWKKSSTKRTYHINTKYFYVTNKVQSGDVVIEFHPTKEMVADYLTKSPNGTTFRMFCNSMTGLDEVYIGQYKAKYGNTRQIYRI